MDQLDSRPMMASDRSVGIVPFENRMTPQSYRHSATEQGILVGLR